MRWRNHKIVTLSIVYAITGGGVASLSAMAGSVLPDVLEMRGMVPHRTVTHYLPFWLVPCLIMFYVSLTADSLLVYVVAFLLSGASFHIIEDALSSGGIPIIHPFGQRIGLGLYKTGCLNEEFSVLGLLILFNTAGYIRGFFSANHIGNQFSVIFRLLGI